MISIGFADHPLDDTFRRGHEMERWTMEYLREGHICVTTPHGEQQFHAPSAMMVPPHTPYFVEWAGRRGQWLEHYAIFDPAPNWHALLHWPQGECRLGFLHLSNPATAREVETSLQEALLLQRSARVHKRPLVQNALEKALLALDEVNAARGNAQHDERIQCVLDYIAQHYQEPLDLAMLSRQVFLSPSRFSHLFKRQIKQAPMQYVEQYRLERAAEKLLQGNEPIEQIALLAGFNNAFHFSTRFRRRFQQSPSRYRRNPR